MAAGLGNINELAVGNPYVSATTTVMPAQAADKWKIFTFTVSGLTVETVTLQGSLDGSTYSNLMPINAATGALAAAITLGNGSYRITDLGYLYLKIIKSAGAETATIWTSGRGF